MDWRAKIPACCGIAGFKFAGHPADVQRAREMIDLAKQSGAPLEEVSKALEEYLLINSETGASFGESPLNRGLSQEHIQEQLDVLELIW